MARESHKERLLTEGLAVVHERGFGGASVRDIARAAGAPQGSFTNHFASKEVFGLEVLNLYFSNAQVVIERTLRNDDLPPLKRLRAYFDALTASVEEYESKRGCLFGNTCAEATDDNEALRVRLVEILDELQGAFEYCLKAAVKIGELPPGTKVRELAGFILSSFQGAVLFSRAYRGVALIERFKRVLFSSIISK